MEFVLQLPAEEVIFPPSAHDSSRGQTGTSAPPEKRLVIPMEVTYGGRELGQFREAILVCSPWGTVLLLR